MEVPHRNVSIRAAGEADLGIRAYSQRVAGWSRGSELGLDAGRLRGQVPDGQRAGLTTHYQGAAVRQQLAGADVIVPVLEETKYRHNGWMEVICRFFNNVRSGHNKKSAAYINTSISRPSPRK